MIERPAERLRGVAVVLLPVGLGVVTLAVVFVSLGHTKLALAVSGLILAAGIVALVPVGGILRMAILLFAFVPFHYLHLRQPLDAFPPPTLLIVLACVGCLPASVGSEHRRPIPRALVLLGAMFIAYTAVVSFASSYSTVRHAVTWVILSAMMLVIAPLLLSRYDGRTTITNTVYWVCTLLAGFAVVEYFTKANFLDRLYARSTDQLTEVWGVYRVFTTLGHPLLNGTVFAVGLTLAFAKLVREPRWATALTVPLLGAAVFVTASRSAFVAAAAGCACVIIVTVVGRQRDGAKLRVITFGALAIVVAAVLGSSSALAHRNSSSEAQLSSRFRFGSLHVLPQLMEQTNYLGAGAASSNSVLQAVGGFYAQFPIENSVVQIVVDYGVIGSLLFLVFVSIILIRGVSRGGIYGPCAFVAYLVSAAGFNLFEAYPSALILPCLLLALSLMEARYSSPPERALRKRTAAASAVRAGRPTSPELRPMAWSG